MATAELVSTEEFRIPYTLAGSVRAFNQELLDQDLIEEQADFFHFGKTPPHVAFSIRAPTVQGVRPGVPGFADGTVDLSGMGLHNPVAASRDKEVSEFG